MDISALDSADSDDCQSEQKDGRFCKICYGADIFAGNDWISPCRCAGSIKWVHRKCLLRWIESAPYMHHYMCNMCGYEYRRYWRLKSPECWSWPKIRLTLWDAAEILLDVYSTVKLVRNTTAAIQGTKSAPAQMLYFMMASENTIAGPNFPIYEALYNELNPQQLNVVDANTVAQFLKRSGIGVLQLSQVWELSDREKNGCLDKIGIFTAFKLIAGLQQGRPLSASLLSDDSVAAPKFQPLATAAGASTASRVLSASAAASPVSCPPGDGGAIGAAYRVQRSASVASRTSVTGEWEIDNQEQNKYETIFYSLKPVNGRLSGEQCRPVLLNSRLPQPQLARIWDLSDVDRDGQLDKYEMCIALHLVYRCLDGEPLPNRLPVSLIHPMKRVQCSISSVAGSISNFPTETRRFSAASIPTDGPMTPLARLTTGSVHSLSAVSADVPATSIFYDKAFYLLFLQLRNADPLAPWPVNVEEHRSRFEQLDTDVDGFVSGLDVKSYAIEFGIPQTVLAHIWALVDVAKSGRMNLEQFALWSEIMKEVRGGISPPKYLPDHLVPPSIRLAGSGSTLSRTSTHGNSMNSISAAAISDNPRIVELNAEIESAMENRRAAEQDLFQLEADTLVKNSEIKNLELELQTLSTTVKQLQHQKVEAGRRLADLDTKIGKLETACAEHGERLTNEEERLRRAKSDIAQANDNFTAEEQTIKELRAESDDVGAKLSYSVKAITEQNAKIEWLADQLTTNERHNDEYVGEIFRVEKLAAELTAILEAYDKASAVENGIEVADEAILRANFVSASGTILASSNNVHKSSLSGDPFQEDPFRSTDEADPFGARPTEFADFSKFAAYAS